MIVHVPNPHRAQHVTCPKGRGPRRSTVAVEGNERLAELGLAPLSPAERRVLVLYGQGLDRARIAREIFRSPKTVDKHRTVLLSKLKLGSGAGGSRRLALFAVKHGYVAPEAIGVGPTHRPEAGATDAGGGA